MRASVAVASCIGVGLVLQGCGGEQKDKECLAKEMDVVSQSMSGKLDISVDVDFGGTTQTTTLMTTFTEKFDFEKFNMREDITDGESMTGTSIINVEERHAITYTSVTVNGTTTKTCTIEKLPAKIPKVSELSMLLETMVKPFLSNQATCGGNDGTYDTWKFNANYSGPLPQVLLQLEIPDLPLPSLNGLNIEDGSVSEDLKMSQDHLLHSSSTVVSGELKNNTETLGRMEAKVSMTIDEVKKGGPSAEELLPSQFDVNCTEANGTMDMQVFFGQLQNGGFARQQLLRILEVSKNSEPVLMV